MTDTAGSTAPPMPSPSPPPRAGAGAGTTWRGAPALRGGKGYVTGPLGQLHYRMVGGGDALPFLLIHQTPFGMVEYVDVQPALAALGRRSIAADNPGYGLSDPPPATVSVPDLADHLVSLLDAIGVTKVIVAGHHTGAALGAAFAARHPDRTAALVLHGCPLYTAEERAERLARPAPDTALSPDGSHLSTTFRRVFDYVGAGSDQLASATWATLGTFFAGPHTPTYQAVFAHDMAADLARLRAPTLLLSDTGDALHPNDLRAHALRPDFTFRDFSSGKSFALMAEPGRWSAIITDFARTHGV
jgi:pimeloyl-ACP methyl ester carboxylesterase